MSPTRTMTINMGPQHPSTHGVLRLVLELDGEMVVKCTPHIGYLHTGIEKGLEGKRFQQGIPLTDRMDYLAPLSNNLVLVLAIEKALGITPPERGQTIRVLLTELTRIKSHLVWLGTHAMDIGAMSVFLYCFREREVILDLYEAVSGQRMMASYFRVGGLAADLPPGFEDKVQAFLETFPARLQEYEALLTENPLWRQRTVGIGAISREDAIAMGLSGPGLRACGVAYDVRKAHPYSSYERYQFDVPLGKVGDVYDRYMVRMAEMRQSHRIATQALARLTPGPINVADPKLIPPPETAPQKVHGGSDPPLQALLGGLRGPRRRGVSGHRGPQGRAGRVSGVRWRHPALPGPLPGSFFREPPGDAQDGGGAPRGRCGRRHRFAGYRAGGDRSLTGRRRSGQ